VKAQFLPASALIAFVLSLHSFGATQAPVSDPQALALAAQSIAMLTGGNGIIEVTLIGSATRIAGSDNRGLVKTTVPASRSFGGTP